MRDLKSYFSDYASYHRTRGNKVCHYIGIPLIMTTLLGLLSVWVVPVGFSPISPFLRLDAGTILILLATLWYLKLDWRLGVPFFFISMSSYFLGRALPGLVLWTFFVLGWILQGVGHYKYEKRSPAFFKNFEHLLIGPLWIFAAAVGYRVDRKISG